MSERDSATGRIEWRPGGRVGDYVLIEKLGQGTMGVVYLCKHVETGTRFALKALSAQASPTLIKRFEREGQAQAAVDAHPNVVRVRSGGAASGYRYLIMDLAAGGDLEARLRNGPLEPRVAARLIAQLAQGLAHVHARGVLHRDLKPSNVLFDSDGTPKLVDFGLATLEGSEGLSKTGDLIGTPVYMAPEQAAGRLRDVDASTDIYGLGAILYHVLTGQRPYADANTVEVVRKVMSEEPPRPRSIDPSIPPALEAICLRAMCKAKSDRIQTAAEFLEALQGFLDGDAEVPPPHVPKALLAAAALSGLVLLILGGVTVLGGDFGPAAPTAERPTEAPPADVAPDPPAQGPLVWDLKQGKIARCSYVHSLDVTQPVEEPVRWTRGGFKSFTRMGWTWRVIEVSDASLAVETTIHSLIVRRESAFGRVEFDSESNKRDESPYAASIDATFTFALDRRSGRVSDVSGVKGIQERIDRQVSAQGKEPHALFYKLPQFESDECMSNVLNQLFYVLPGTGHKPDRAWTLREVIEPIPVHGRSEWRRGRTRTMTRVMGMTRPEEAVDLTFRVTGRAGKLHISWEGAGENRTVRGEGDFANGRLRRVELKESSRCRDSWGGGSRILKSSQVFELKSR